MSRKSLGLAASVVAVALMVPGAVSAKSYWFESYQRTVDLIDDNRLDEAATLLASLIADQPQPKAGVRIPGNQFVDYLPYYQRARIELLRGNFEGAGHSLDVSEAFGAVKRNRKAMRQLTEMRAQVDRSSDARDANGAVSVSSN